MFYDGALYRSMLYAWQCFATLREPDFTSGTRLKKAGFKEWLGGFLVWRAWWPLFVVPISAVVSAASATESAHAATVGTQSPAGSLDALAELPHMASASSLAAQLSGLHSDVLLAEQRRALGIDQMLQRDIQARTRAAAARENKAWQAVAGREDWERFRDRRVAGLRESLGSFPGAGKPAVGVGVTLAGER